MEDRKRNVACAEAEDAHLEKGGGRDTKMASVVSANCYARGRDANELVVSSLGKVSALSLRKKRNATGTRGTFCARTTRSLWFNTCAILRVGRT